MPDSGIFLAKINYIVDLRLIGGAVDVKIIQVAEPPVTKTMAFIDAIIMKAHTGNLLLTSRYRYVRLSTREHGEMRATRATGAARSSSGQRCKDYASKYYREKRSRTISQAVVGERDDARRKLK